MHAQIYEKLANEPISNVNLEKLAHVINTHCNESVCNIIYNVLLQDKNFSKDIIACASADATPTLDLKLLNMRQANVLKLLMKVILPKASADL